MIEGLTLRKEKAEEANRVKTLSNNMSHEFRTPLISILGYSEILKKRLLTKNILKCFQNGDLREKIV
ncbi:MAG: hypothetical protein IPN18_12970 [Ignavibacteriales bacterium]|nr:hypothetical protein [Ignavibacteriales bacterium]